jgi:putative transcriptional regulator
MTLDALFAHYAAGNLTPATHALVKAHLALSPRNRAWVQDLELLVQDWALGEKSDTVMERSENEERFPSQNRMLQSILQSESAHCPPIRIMPERSLAASAGKTIPPPDLEALLGFSLNDTPWRTKLPGLKEWHMKDDRGEEVSLIWVRQGMALPTHTHEGTEITLVLQGGFSDATGHYQVGDIAFADQEIDHRPVADKGEDCICFAVTDAPLRLTGPVGKWFAPFMG